MIEMARRGEPILFHYSRYAALAGGILLPLIETARRWGTGNYLLWVDDYLIGAALLFAAWQVRRGAGRGRAYLAAAWGFTCGIGYMSLVGHWLSIDQPDVSGVDSRFVTGALGIGLLLALLALYGSLLRPSED
jgi:hypothetical protein